MINYHFFPKQTDACWKAFIGNIRLFREPDTQVCGLWLSAHCTQHTSTGAGMLPVYSSKPLKLVGGNWVLPVPFPCIFVPCGWLNLDTFRWLKMCFTSVVQVWHCAWGNTFPLYWAWAQCKCFRIIFSMPSFEFWRSLLHLSFRLISFNYHFLLRLLQVCLSFAIWLRKVPGRWVHDTLGDRNASAGVISEQAKWDSIMPYILISSLWSFKEARYDCLVPLWF